MLTFSGNKGNLNMFVRYSQRVVLFFINRVILNFVR